MAFVSLTKTDLADPDALYHFRISQLTLQNGLVRALPQIEQMPWSKQFIDKEFLFHVLTVPSYWAGGELGVKILALGLGLGILWTFISILAGLKLNRTCQFLAVLALLSQASYVFRISMIRPHILAILLYLINIRGLLRADTRWTSVSSFLLPLSYHVLYLGPLNLICAAVFMRKSRRAAQFGLFAFGVGVLVHPYFPGIFQVFLTQLRSGVGVKEFPRWIIPAEFFHPGFSVEWSVLLAVGGAIALGLYWFKDLRRLSEENQAPVLFLGSLLFVWALAFCVNYRAIEYVYPVSLLFIAAATSALPRNFIQAPFIYGVVGFGALLITLQNEPRKGYGAILQFLEQNQAVLTQIPAQKKDAKVFNCSWNQGNLIFYHRPDLRFVDLLDPTYFFEFDSRRFNLREELNEGNVPDPYQTVRNDFGSEFFLCEFGNVNLQLELDPRFRRITPDKLDFMLDLGKRGVNSTQLALYEADSSVQNVFLTQLSMRSQECKVWKASEAELEKHTGALLLGLGGALRPQVSLNGKVLMEERPPSSVKAVVAELLPLTHSIRKKDDLQFRICRKPDLNLENQILISLWDKEAIERDCQMKSNLGPMFQDRDFTREMQKKFQFNSLSVCAEARVLTVGPKK